MTPIAKPLATSIVALSKNVTERRSTRHRILDVSLTCIIIFTFLSECGLPD
jgi:hypothetical protein